MQADVADALAARGEHSAAAALYEGQSRLFLRETWHELAAVVLPKLARCQKVPSTSHILANVPVTHVSCSTLRARPPTTSHTSQPTGPSWAGFWVTEKSDYSSKPQK